MEELKFGQLTITVGDCVVYVHNNEEDYFYFVNLPRRGDNSFVFYDTYTLELFSDLSDDLPDDILALCYLAVAYIVNANKDDVDIAHKMMLEKLADEVERRKLEG